MEQQLIFTPNSIFLGFIQLATDYTLDMEIGDLLGQIPDIKWRLQKLPIAANNDITISTYNQLKNSISSTANNFIPKDNSYGSLTVLALACTSMSFALTPSLVHKELRKGYNCKATDMATSLLTAVNAFVHMKPKLRIALLTPYNDELHQKNLEFLADFNIVKDKNLNLSSDSQTSALDPECIKTIIKNMDMTDVDLLIIACNAFNVTNYGFISELEHQSIYVLTSTQALLWYSLHLAIPERVEEIKKIWGYGHLFNLIPII